MKWEHGILVFYDKSLQDGVTYLHESRRLVTEQHGPRVL